MSTRFSSWPHRRMEHHGQEGAAGGAGAGGPAVERIPVELLERILELLPASTKRQDCLSLLRVSKLW